MAPDPTAVVRALLLWNSYRVLEKVVVGFVSLIGLAFLAELARVHTHWPAAAMGWARPMAGLGSMVLIMSILGAGVMPHNLFLNSEFIQSCQ